MNEIKRITNTVENYFELLPGSCQFKTRKREIVQARQVSMYFAKMLTKLSLTNIGMMIGGKDHSTVLHAMRTVKNLIETDKGYKADIDNIEKRLRYIFELIKKRDVTIYIKPKGGDMYERHFDSVTMAQNSYDENEVEWVDISIDYCQKVETEPVIEMIEARIPEMEGVQV